MRRITTIACLVMTMIATGVPSVGATSTDGVGVDDQYSYVVVDQREISVTVVAPNGEDVVSTGTLFTLVPGSDTEFGIEAGCTITIYVGQPVMYNDPSSPTRVSTSGYAYVTVSSGCTEGMGWTHYLQHQNVAGIYVNVATSSYKYTPVGSTKTSWLSRQCNSRDSTSWRGRIYNGTNHYSSPKTLTCET